MKDLFLIDLNMCFNGDEIKSLSSIIRKYDVEIYDITSEESGECDACITFQGYEEDILKLGEYFLGKDEDFIRESMRMKMN
jgi:hypothetical protein